MNKIYLPPAEIAAFTAEVGVKKTSMNKVRSFVLSIIAGAYIALAAIGSNTAAHGLLANPETYGQGKLAAAVVFAVGLMMVLIAGAELFTGNCLIIVGVLEKKVKAAAMALNLCTVWLGNLVGGVLVSWIAATTGLFNGGGNLLAAVTIKIAAGKCVLGFGDAFLLGILCNILVCLGVWMSFAAQDTIGKLFASGFPVFLFVCSGYEHCIANMAYIPMGIFAKANPAYVQAALDLGVSQSSLDALNWGNMFVTNMIPVTLGNIVGGSVCVGLLYWFVYLKKAKKN
ncbi:MAG: formate/nitrite transporter family protein [Firmicutes bacterium]|nr:formate/nitrite transporter family protein [Bacillota bacterium]